VPTQRINEVGHIGEVTRTLAGGDRGPPTRLYVESLYVVQFWNVQAAEGDGAGGGAGGGALPVLTCPYGTNAHVPAYTHVLSSPTPQACMPACLHACSCTDCNIYVSGAYTIAQTVAKSKVRPAPMLTAHTASASRDKRTRRNIGTVIEEHVGVDISPTLSRALFVTKIGGFKLAVLAVGRAKRSCHKRLKLVWSKP